VLFIILLKGVRDHRVEYSRNLLLSTLFLTAIFVLLPRIVFGSAYADMRLAPFVIAIALIALRPRHGLSVRGASTLAALGLLFCGARLVGTTISYIQFDREYDRTLAALDHVPKGARLLTMVGRTCRDEWLYSRLEHAAGIALERRIAYANDQWSMAGGQLLTVRYTPAGHFAHDPSQLVTDRRCRGEWWRPLRVSLAYLPREAFDYVWLINPAPVEPAFLTGLTPIWRSGRDVLYRIDDRRRPDVVLDPDLLPPRRRPVSPLPS
jgi:hypothetical protein